MSRSPSDPPASAERVEGDAAPLRVALFGEHGFGNLGNDASVRVVIAMIRRIAPHAEIRAYGYVPEQMSQAFAVPAFSINNAGMWAERLPRPARLAAKALGKVGDPLRTVLQVRGADVVLVPGTGVFEGDLGIKPFGRPFTLLRMALAGRLNRARVAFVAVGASPVRERWSRAFMRTAAGLAHYRSYRDLLSRSTLESLGVRTTGDPVYSDVVFSLPAPVPPQASAEPGTPVVAVGVMYYQGTAEAGAERRSTHEEYVDKIVGFVEWLLERGYRVRITVGERVDRIVAEEILSRLPSWSEDGALTSAVVDRFDDLLSVFAESDVVVATRYHNIVAAVMAAKPVISIGYALKNDALLQDAGLASYTQHIATLDVEHLRRQFDRVTSDAEEVVRTLDAYRETARARVAEQEADLRDRVLAPRRRGRR